ncbi:flagellar export chaperone FliS [Alloacidobacterium sp.]|uniref:flagellar export chaperone FliS n=1 Tax=Alloacidobacterium sp. TaxID=2951999 RepID=UPI002D32EB14|nr:flagellar export chaperone FliS [Alloacidobacterium sp.]HYK34645.1 flagellar export chaperone FliS [Alloacidobacterium sp.]
MQNRSYQQQSVAGKNGVELIVALYDGMVRFLNRAIAATGVGDVQERRIAVKRVLDILIHLQSRLRMEAGGPAKALSEFYAAIFALCLEGSRLSSPERFRKAIECIWPVREAWRQAAQDPETLRQFSAPGSTNALTSVSAASATEGPIGSRWTA